MDFDAGIPMSRGGAGLPAVTEETSLSPSLSEDAMWQMNLRSSETMEAGPYPERPGELDCSYYIRTGLCRFGPTCRFNHPPNRKLTYPTMIWLNVGRRDAFVSKNVFLYAYIDVNAASHGVAKLQFKFWHARFHLAAIAAARMKGEFPERIGQPECQGPEKLEESGIDSCLNGKLLSSNLQETFINSDYSVVNPLKQFIRTALGLLGIQVSGVVRGFEQCFRRLQAESVMGNCCRVVSLLSYLMPPLILFLYYLKTGTCKFGATCKFHHPRDKAGVSGRVSLNILGYPLRLRLVKAFDVGQNEMECAYYLRTGQCKFGSTCKFHHPQPTNVMVPLRGSPVYPTVNSPTTPGQQSYPGGLATNWSRASFITSPRWQAPSNYTPLILPQGVVSVPGWNAYSVLVFVLGDGDLGLGGGCFWAGVYVFHEGAMPTKLTVGQVGSVSSPESQQQTGNSQIYGTSRQSESVNAGSQGTFSPYRSDSVPMGFYALQRESVFPERPGQPECQFYMKTGDCKFGAVCRFHHPRERLIPAPDCVLSAIGLPLRPGEPLCIFYSRYGICKFGPSCKFHHPMGIFTYNLTASSSADTPVRRLLGSSSGSAALTLSSEGLVEAGSTKPRRLSLSEPRQMAPGDDNIDTGG
ncbi:hypothetical protein POTOM_059187 [Populus tomentosa]|uniref:C3H1-type domain-containing protein n=1 Tax=Populus tomentosa TaxID=118781 RepID=A0A8X8BZP1_POPTO|nr:hypothetical protein POTOM_059187 [Populus tomentosa]